MPAALVAISEQGLVIWVGDQIQFQGDLYELYDLWLRVSLLQLHSLLHWPGSGDRVYKKCNCASALQPDYTFCCFNCHGANLPPATIMACFNLGANSKGHTAGAFYLLGA